jgi:hypothetical protein
LYPFFYLKLRYAGTARRRGGLTVIDGLLAPAQQFAATSDFTEAGAAARFML